MLTLTPIPLTDAPNLALVSALQDTFGPDAIALAGLTLVGASVPDCLVQHTLEGSRFDLSEVLQSDALRHVAPTLTAQIDRDRLSCFEQMSPAFLAASLGEALAGGGPDLACRPAMGVAHRLARAWVEAIAGDGLDEMTVLHSRSAWSAWFGCEVWDRTWVIVDGVGSRITILCVTGDTAPWLPRLR